MAYEVNTEKWIKSNFPDCVASSTSDLCLTYNDLGLKSLDREGILVWEIKNPSALGESYTNNMLLLKEDFLIKQYVIKADPNGGLIDSGWTKLGLYAIKSINYGDTFGELPTVHKNGYTFTNWQSNGIEITSTTLVNKILGLSEPTIVAQWAQAAYKIILKDFDEEKTKSVGLSLFLQLPKATPATHPEITINYHENFNLGELDPSSNQIETEKHLYITYNKVSWHLKEDLSDSPLTDNSYVNDEDLGYVPGITSITLYPEYEEVIEAYDIKVSNPFVRSTYKFLGFSKNPLATEAEYAAGTYFLATEDCDFYCIWSAYIYELKYTKSYVCIGRESVAYGTKFRVKSIEDFDPSIYLSKTTEILLVSRTSSDITLGAGENGEYEHILGETLDSWQEGGRPRTPGETYIWSRITDESLEWQGTSYNKSKIVSLPTYKPTKQNTYTDSLTVYFIDKFNSGIPSKYSRIPTTWKWDGKWYYDDLCTTELIVGETYDKNVLYARYKFDGTEQPRETVQLPKLEHEGYIHMGWSTKDDATVADFAPGDLYTPTTDTILYAVWKSNAVVGIDWINLGNTVSFTPYKILDGVKTDLLPVSGTAYTWEITGNNGYKITQATEGISDTVMDSGRTVLINHSTLYYPATNAGNTDFTISVTIKNAELGEHTFTTMWTHTTGDVKNQVTITTSYDEYIKQTGAIAYLTFYNASGSEIHRVLLSIEKGATLSSLDALLSWMYLWSLYNPTDDSVNAYISVTEDNGTVSNFGIAKGNGSFISVNTVDSSPIGTRFPITLYEPDNTNDTLNITLYH